MAMSVVYGNFCGLLVHENRGGTPSDYVGDNLGSVGAVLDNTGSAIYSAEYWPYGEVRSESGSNPSNWGFVGLRGYFRDLVNKLLYVRARYLALNSGQWLTLDPLWPLARAYQYVGQNPATRVDPTGLFSIEELNCCADKAGITLLWETIIGAGAACVGCILACVIGMGLPGFSWTIGPCLAACSEVCGIALGAAIIASLIDFFKCLTSGECQPKPNESCVDQCKNIPPGREHRNCIYCCYYGCGPNPQPWQPFKPVACAVTTSTAV